MVFQVERDRRGRVWLLFGLLVVVCLVPAAVLLMIVSLVVYAAAPAASLFVSGVRWYQIVPTVGVAVVGAVIYWWASRYDARGRLLKAMGGRPLDPNDPYHQRLANIVEEMRLASGEGRVEAVVVPSLGMNAFAFSDLRNSSVIGVSEGLVSSLPRAQLEAVVAHEFAHVLSRTHVTVTAACLLFGMWESFGDTMGRMSEGVSDGDRVLADGASSAGGLFIGLVQLAGAVVNGALSRQREFEADAAAVRYTRDPLALALALRAIADCPLGSGYVPPGLAAMCITAERISFSSRGAALMASHPPVDQRIAALLALANTSRREFEAQAAEAARISAARTHVTEAPARPGYASAATPRTIAGPIAASASGGGAVPPFAATRSAIGGAAAGGSEAAALHRPAGAASLRIAAGDGGRCPACRATLSTVDYEGVPVAACRTCGGRLARTADVARLAVRREVRFTDEQYGAAAQIVAEGNQRRRAAILERRRRTDALRNCPVCDRPMVRRHFSLDLAVEIDSCEACEVCWFDADELEIVQIVAEQGSRSAD